MLVIQDYTLYHLQFLKRDQITLIFARYSVLNLEVVSFTYSFLSHGISFVLELETLNKSRKINFHVKDVRSADEWNSLAPRTGMLYLLIISVTFERYWKHIYLTKRYEPENTIEVGSVLKQATDNIWI
jgi:hypothetical protein